MKPGAAPFGTLEPPIARKPNTVWTSADVWLRREFEMPAGQFTDLALLLHHDEDTEVYINGVLTVKVGGYNAAYDAFDIAPAALAASSPARTSSQSIAIRLSADSISIWASKVLHRKHLPAKR